MEESPLEGSFKGDSRFNFTPMEPDVNYLNMFLTDLAITNVLAMGVLAFLGQPLIQF